MPSAVVSVFTDEHVINKSADYINERRKRKRYGYHISYSSTLSRHFWNIWKLVPQEAYCQSYENIVYPSELAKFLYYIRRTINNSRHSAYVVYWYVPSKVRFMGKRDYFALEFENNRIIHSSLHYVGNIEISLIYPCKLQFCRPDKTLLESFNES